ncbi:hypothetical protein BGX23_000490 [Mortierella sp. AD031]|nr:hypothetical protein BGX23_000490 [Mortierella sp. AD031]
MSPSSPSSSPSTSATPPSKKVFRLHGVNVLNRTNVDSAARQTALERRRAAHILDERQRRDTMNRLLAELAHLSEDSADEVQVQLELQQSIPNPDGSEKKPIVKSHSITTLRNAIAEIHRLRTQAGLKRLASYKEVLTSYRSVSPGSSQQASRKNAHPESSVDLYTSAPPPLQPPSSPSPPDPYELRSSPPHTTSLSSKLHSA